jgi:hypothetical protein
VADKFSLALSETRRALRRADFHLPALADEGMRCFLEIAQEVYEAGCLTKKFGTRDYTGQLLDETWAMLRAQYSHPDDLVKRGYKLAERILLYHIREIASPRNPDQPTRIEQFVKEYTKQGSAVYKEMVDMYLKVYARLRPIDLYDRVGRPLGRAHVAATIALEEYRGTRTKRAAYRGVVEELVGLIERERPRHR